MANVVEIRITGSNDANSAFEQVRRQMREVGREAEETSRRTQQFGHDSDEVGRSAGQMSRMLGRASQGFFDMGQSATEAGASIGGKGGPHAAIAMLAAALSAAPILATAAGTAITLGVGGALAGLGMKAASSSVEVQSAFGAMKERVVSEFQEISTPWESTLLSMSAIGESTFDGLSDSLRAAFGRMAPEVTEFMFDVGDALGEFEPMIDRLSVAFGPLLSTLGDRLPDIVGTLADAFTKIGEAADPRALDMMIDGFNGLVMATAEVIVFFERTATAMALSWDGIKDIGGGIKDLFTGMGTAAGDAESVGDALADVGSAALDAAGGIADLRDEMEQLAGKELSARDAARNFEEAIDAAAESAKKHGRTLNTNTAAGRANQKALDNIAKSALEMKAAVEEAGGDSSKAMLRARNSFVNTARGMGLTRGQAEQLADKLGLVKEASDRVPKNPKVTLHQNGIGAAIRASKELRGGLNAVPKNPKVTLHQNGIGAAIRASKELGSSVRGIPGRKSVTVSFHTVGAAALQGALNLLNSLPGSVGSGYAHGGIVGATPAAGGGPRSGWTLVGEQGPELIKVAPGSTVVPAGKTATMLGRNKGPQIVEGRDPAYGPPRLGFGEETRFFRRMPTTLEIRSGGSGLDDLLVELLRKAIRVRGGDVQVVLGR